MLYVGELSEVTDDRMYVLGPADFNQCTLIIDLIVIRTRIVTLIVRVVVMVDLLKYILDD